MKCTNCSTQNPDDAKHCRRCGAVLPVSAVVVQPTMVANDADRTQPLNSEAEITATRPLQDPSALEPVPVETSPATADATRPLPRAKMFFEPLPERALLADAQYKIGSLIEDTPMLNTYTAISRRAVIECRNCSSSRNTFGDQHCKNCGASLADLEPRYPMYLVKETIAPDAINAERRIAELNLQHGGALLPIESFNETIFGTRRVYVVLPEPSPFSGAQLPNHPEMTDVVNWGLQLANALVFLHKNNIILGTADLEHISIGGKIARWFNFAGARIGDSSARSAKLYTDDVLSLAASLFALLTGRAYSPKVQISPQGLSDTFQQTFSGKITTAVQLADRLHEAIQEIRRPNSYDLRIGRLSDVGQMRQINEDSLFTFEAGMVHRSISSPIGLYVVADGMGGQAAGDVASGLAIHSIAERAAETLMPPTLNTDPQPVDVDTWLREAIALANDAVYKQRIAADNNMGTTLVMAIIAEGEAHVAHLGDSRAYLISPAGLKQITIDHSLVQRLIDTKQLTAEEAKTHPQRNVIYKNLGDRPTVDPDIDHVPLESGDQLLLCSDGLSGYVDESEILRIIKAAHSPQEACRNLIDAANANGGPDNITAIIIQLETLS
jgi:protein phosphatase